MSIVKFEIGQTYQTRSICDYDCIYSVKILKRTEKRITFQVDGRKETSTKGIKIFDGAESCFFDGYYSFAPIIRATKKVIVE